ncbi:putative OPA3-like protein CG43998 [Drosophila kikkawai]|uniref:OPA3-like protein CG43998 n=1 Tax=Drosophila kikkawai TaxID=30033 RepID=A0A6P4JL29_DROKI|nr:putative OPA3-like protein CG43998 [Drosophila kikkawai]
MVIGSFPLGKIFVHGLKRVSKPIGNLLMWAGKHNPHVRRYIIIPPAQLYNKFEVRWKMQMLRLKQPKRVPPLPSAIATQLGTDMLSEVIVFIIGGGLIVHEFSRQQLKTRKKLQEEMEQRRVLFEQLDGISADLEQQDKDISYIRAVLNGNKT